MCSTSPQATSSLQQQPSRGSQSYTMTTGHCLTQTVELEAMEMYSVLQAELYNDDRLYSKM